MTRKSPFAAASLLSIALVAAIYAPPLRGSDAASGPIAGQLGTEQAAPASAPVLLAQGRCFNGRCF